MADIKFKAVQFEGLVPALDERQLDRPHIIEGANFIFTAEGPQSAFGALVLSVNPLHAQPEHCYSFQVEEDIYYFTPNGVFSYDPGLDVFNEVYNYSTHWTGNQYYKWSSAHVGRDYFFFHPNLGDTIITYSTVTGAWSTFNSPYMPYAPRYITQAVGRLIILGEEQWTWSAQENGRDIDPASNTNAGFQGKGLVGGTPLVVEELHDGFLTYTTTGVVVSQLIQGNAAVFRHRLLTREVQIMNPFSIVNVDSKRHIAADKSGLFVTNGDVFQPYKPIFTEFLINIAYRELGLNFRLEYNKQRERLHFSFMPIYQTKEYTRSYVLTETLDKWGSMDRAHYCILPVNSPVNYAPSPNLGFIAEDGIVKEITADPFIQEVENGQIVRQPLNSFIRIGMFRFDEQKDTDQFGEVQNLSLGYNFGPIDDWFEDWNILSGTEDWNVLEVPEEDWGKDIKDVQEFQVTIRSSLDGYQTFQEVTPERMKQQPAQSFYACRILGLFFEVQISAFEIGESYHIKTLELAGVLAGRL